MLEPEYAALERIHVIELDRGRKVDEPFDEASTVAPVAIARRRSVCTGCGVQYGDEACDRSLPTARYSLLPTPYSLLMRGCAAQHMLDVDIHRVLLRDVTARLGEPSGSLEEGLRDGGGLEDGNSPE